MGVLEESLNTVIIDSHPVVRVGVASVLESSCGCVVVGGFGSIEDATPALEGEAPALVVMELCLGDIVQFDGIRAVLKAAPSMTVLILTQLNERVYAERAIASGAAGYIEKSAPISEIHEAVSRVSRGLPYLGASVLKRRSARESAVRAPIADPLDKLTKRELEVFHLVGKGMSASEIAKALFLSTKTVDVHRMSMRKKLGLRNSYELVRYACSVSV
ncbi:MAG: DNA-binding response regulator [Deltaproteobacteria bacterium]|nr:MAG: DNA-binding response regulator [Deltaproteobacteria bacterium]